MIYEKESFIRASAERVFGFHELPDVLSRLTPPWENARVIQQAPTLRPGARAIIETRLFGIVPVRWVAEHTLYDPPRSFEDVQLSGPFRSWRHKHIVEPRGEGSVLRDVIHYEPHFGALGKLLAPVLIEPRLRRMFDYRHRVTRQWCEGSGTPVALSTYMEDRTNRKRTHKKRGWVIAGVSLAVLFGIIALKGQADSEGDSELN